MADSDQDAPASEQSPAPSQDAQARDRKAALDRKVKLAFLAVVVAGAGIIYYYQRKGPQLAWPKATEAMVEKAKKDNRPVALFFMVPAPDGDTRNMIADSLLHDLVKIQLKRHKYVAAVVVDTEMKSPLAKRFKVEELPTLVVISAKGEQYKQNVTGFVGPADVAKLLGGNARQE